MTKVQVTAGVRCPECDHEPFRNRAGLGAHMAAIHHLRLDGTPAKARQTTSKRNGDNVTISIKGREIRLVLNNTEIRRLLIDHPEAAADALLTS